ncbi:MAG: BCCT family transporter [Yaniella sp.]|uniref:BCCT family transporter n=1 Tax=Yaniella sp. TaxID=2773929 RepID=UPI00264A17B3|nr:BCCT family transporter [Yaniella sp.]MDN5703987.1 BCCT family transporter [Yaniella sp.]MDN5731813.1 BCCT family transporter [Yaniella sp.]MDN5815780.1 BCCT family transporter [Yaniella sp.]MDN5818592.1 BCCT family transporter [Yaniella sp.]MDN5838718.1 BCCT family transporter [Yaniella sp.]
MEDLPQEHRLHDEDSDARIVGKLRAQGVRIGRGMIAPAVFWPSLIIVGAFAIFGIFFPEAADTVLSSTQNWIVATFGWWYMLVIAAFIVFVLVISFSKYGKIKLGGPNDKPEFSTMSWFTMLFSAGMGVGLIFYGTAEPLIFAETNPNPGWEEGGPREMGHLAMAQTFVHWGLHPWAVYAVIGLAIAYAVHRRGRPVSIRWAFEPILGHRVKGWMGDVIDILAIFGTLFGIATSLGLGAQQIAAGLGAMGIVEDSTSTTLLMVIIIVITILALASVVSGLGRGIKWLSNFNISLAGILLIAVLLLGPTLFLVQNLVESFGAYLSNVAGMTFDVQAYTGQEGQDWSSLWTLFYWGWWIAWAPFVGVFIARISRGRTVREFITAVMLVPFTVGVVWFSIMGGASLFKYVINDTDMSPILGDDGSLIAEETLFDILGGLPLGSVLSVIAIIVIAIFFITSSDSGSLVVDMLASGGHPNPPIWSRVLFAVLEGVLAAALLLAGGLTALQAGSLITALPFSILLAIMCVAIVRAFRVDHLQISQQRSVQEYYQLSDRLAADFDDAFGPKVDHRIDYRLQATRGVLNRGSGRGTATVTEQPATDESSETRWRPGRKGKGRRKK